MLASVVIFHGFLSHFTERKNIQKDSLEFEYELFLFGPLRSSLSRIYIFSGIKIEKASSSLLSSLCHAKKDRKIGRPFRE